MLRIYIFLITFALFSLSEGGKGCGYALPMGSLICGIGFNGIRLFKTNLCTHVTIAIGLKCENEVCNPVKTTAVETAIDYLRSNIPIGMYVHYSLSNEDYLTRRSRRVNTVNSIIGFMQTKNLSFIQFYEDSWRPEFKNNEWRSYLQLIQDLSEPLHARKWHIGMTLDVGYDKLQAKLDLADLSTFVDWFNIPNHREERLENGKYFLGSSYPLAYKNKEGSTVKYFIDYMLRSVRPECLLVQIDLRGRKYVALHTDVNPGPGSESHPHFTYHSFKEICQRIVDDHCYEGWDEEASTPFSTCRSDYYSYENATSISLKVDFVKARNLAGLLLWSVDIDDDQSVCGQGLFPNLKACQGIRKA